MLSTPFSPEEKAFGTCPVINKKMKTEEKAIILFKTDFISILLSNMELNHLR